MTPEEYDRQQEQLANLTTQAAQAIRDESLAEIGCSWLQKRYHLTYALAVSLLDRLEASHVIGPFTPDLRLRPVLLPGASYSIFD